MYVYQLTNTSVITCLRGCPLGETTAYIIKYERIKTGIELIYEKQMFFLRNVYCIDTKLCAIFFVRQHFV